MQAHICYTEKLLTFQYKGTTVRKKLEPLPDLKSENFLDRGVNKLTLLARAEVIVQLPVTKESCVKEGIIERAELLTGVYLAESSVRVDSGHIIKSILNTRDTDVEMPRCEIQVIELEQQERREVTRMGLTDHREDGVTKVVVGRRKW